MIRAGYKSMSEALSLSDIQGMEFSSSFMNDRAEIKIDGINYVKIGKSKWQANPSQGHAIGGVYSDQQIYDKVKSAKEVKVL